MQFKITSLLVAMNVMALVAATPAPVPVAAPEPAADGQVAPRAALAAKAWEHSNHAGEVYRLSDHGIDCVTLVQSWKDRWSTIDIMPGFECYFYKNPFCEILSYEFLNLYGGTQTVLTAEYPDYNDKISAYRCLPWVG